MINFFRKIRKQLANENKFAKYFRYAFGEVVLIMLGIFMALQLQNWNEKRKQKAQFKVTLEQLYNSLKFDADNLNGLTIQLNSIINQTDTILTKGNSIPENDIPYSLYYLEIANNPYKSQTHYHVQNLKYNPDDYEQNEISKQIIHYANHLDFIDYEIDDDVIKALKEINLAYPKVNPKSPNNGWIYNDSIYYSKTDIIAAKELLTSGFFRTILKTYRTHLIYLNAKARVRYGDAISLMKLLKNYYPLVKILFMDVGIKGTAIDGFDNVNGKSTPMMQTDVENGIWEIDIYLLEGRIKFRCRDSWAQNWGSSTFPNGIGTHDGPDIIVPEAGNYHIIFKPKTGEYQFIKQDD